MSMFATKYANNIRTVSGIPQLYNDDVVLECDTTAGAVTINLLEIPASKWNTIWKLYVYDKSNNAGVNNITIVANFGQTINGGANIKLNTNGAGCIIKISSNTSFLASLSSGGGAGAVAILDEGNLLTPQVAQINFLGAGIKATSVGNDVTVEIEDTGWIDLLGFNHYVGVQKPQVRRLGKVIYFKGTCVIPLSVAGVLQNFSSSTAYAGIASADPYIGAGGVTINPNGSIVFNNGATVLPPQILEGGLKIDSSIVIQKVAQRAILFPSGASTSLSAFFTLVINTTGVLTIATIFDGEDVPGSTSVNTGSSPLRFITSRVRATDYASAYGGVNPNIGGAPGTLATRGEGVGGSGVAYVHGQKVALTPVDIQVDSYGDQWPFDCDAGNPYFIGGFGMGLDGLHNFIQ